MRENTELHTCRANWPRVFNELLTLSIPGVIISCVLMANHGFAQLELGYKDIQALKESTVIFVLPTRHRKIEALRQSLIMTESDRTRDRLQKQLDREKSEVDSFSTALSNAVSEYYTFSDYAIIPDTQLEGWVSKQLPEYHYFVARRSQTESGALALMLFDNTGKSLNRPLPYFIRIFRYTSVFDAFFGSSNYSWRDLDVVIQQWSEKLEKYYHKSHP